MRQLVYRGASRNTANVANCVGRHLLGRSSRNQPGGTHSGGKRKMKRRLLFRRIELGLVSLFLTGTALAQATSTWVSFGPGGTLQYHTDANGNKIMDFSFAGYKQGGVALPVVPAVVTI